MASPSGVEGTERIIVKRHTVERGAADVFDALPREFKETISEVHFADGELNVGQIGAYGIDVDDEWLARITGEGEFGRPSNLIEVVRISQLGRGLRWQDEPESRDAATQEIEDFDVDPLEPYLTDAPPFPEIVDPDTGTGQFRYYRLGPVLDQGSEGACFSGGTLVRMADGSHKAIEDVRLGEKVATAEGNAGRVLALYMRDHDGGLLNVRLRGHNLLRCTPNHPVLTKRGYVRADELHEGDEVALTRTQASQSQQRAAALVPADWLTQADYGRRTNEGLVMAGGVLTQVSAPPERIALSPEFGRLVGLYLAEGATTPNRVTWTFAAKEAETLVAETVRLIEQVLGAKARLQYRPNNSVNVVLYGKLWKTLFERLFGTGSAEKRLPGELASGPPEFLRALLNGWLDGDGFRRRTHVYVSTVSHRLALDMYAIAQTLGLRPVLNTRVAVRNRYARARRRLYELEIAEGGGKNLPEQTDVCVWRKVREVIFESFAGVVYNMHVEGDESYVAEGVGVHNCTGFCGANFLNCSPMMVRPLLTNDYAHQFYYRNQQIDEWPGECVDMETECLSERGWLRHHELEVGDRILTFDVENGGLRWSTVKRIHGYVAKPYRVFGQRGTDIAVTDNHRWLVTNRNLPGRYELVKTLDLKAQHAAPRAALSLEQPEAPIYDDDFVEMVAWAICEGHYRKLGAGRGERICITQKTHRQHVAALMERVGVGSGCEKSPGEGAWEIGGELATMIRAAAPDKVPDVGWLQRLTLRQIRLFIETCLLADGNAREQEGRKTALTFAQRHGPILDAFLTACVLAGQPVSRALRRDDGVDVWTLRGSNLIQRRKLSPGPYISGPVWCPETDAGTFVARRGGTIFITGNSYSGSSVTAMCKQLLELGRIKKWAVTSSFEEMVRWKLAGAVSGAGGTLMLSTPWYEGMYVTDATGYIRPTGRKVGGHAILDRGVSQWRSGSWFNSWGAGFGNGGVGNVSEADYRWLISQRLRAFCAIQTA